ncbi:LapA family protein [Haloactinomyces albus]|uniref:Integral membrane protein n=1 Tax=Haloactinomyces albus TaxID=1352928 RepID=A0AAE3ZEH3_9ACTN|nr:lipopolysaccharide assembly protein LapA domain-containing protein [Haloactinomyces albus]MDR7302074.1 putative integral membrane protein [Haloactinomyces albus]
MSNSDNRQANSGESGRDDERPMTPESTSAGKPEPIKSQTQRSGTSGHTRTAGTWAAVVIATVALIVLLVFILQNLQQAAITFFGIRTNLPIGVALLLAAAIGGLLVALVGAARILQLRRSQHRRRRQ